LEAVLEDLRGHTNALEEQVAGLSARHGELATREGGFREQLAEAEVRHTVGEYDETKWQGIRAEMMKVILQVREELNHTHGEIERLTEVLATIRAPVEPQPVAPIPLPSAPAAARPPASTSGQRSAAAPEAHVARAPEPEPAAPPPAAEPARPAAQAAASGTAEIPFRPVSPKPPAPKPTPAPKKEDAPGRTLWFPSGKPGDQAGGKLDELAFLKSVTGETAAPSAPAAAPASTQTPIPKPRASAGFTRPATIEPAPPPEPVPVVEPRAPLPSGETVKDRGSGLKTLKCAECGTLNRPTEWYCERCGAELAAL
jgi:hypothetical protein